MSNETFEAQLFSNTQLVDLLELGLEPSERVAATLTELQRLPELPHDELIQSARDALHTRGLGIREAASLLGVKELTVKRWFETSADLNTQPRLGLAALAALLPFADEENAGSEVSGLVGAAISRARQANSQTTDLAAGDPATIVMSAFGSSGLMASALYVAMQTSFRMGHADTE